MKNSIVTDISLQIRITYLAKFWFSSYGLKCCWPIKLQDSLKCNISRKKGKNEVYFWHVEKHLHLILLYCVCLARHNQSTQNTKLAYLCNISRKTWAMKFFLPPGKCKSFLQGGSIILNVRIHACPRYPK